MQAGSLTKVIRQEGPVVWQFKWSEKALDGKRIYRKRIIVNVDQYESREAARSAVADSFQRSIQRRELGTQTGRSMASLSDQEDLSGLHT
jgi:hypothetical protein